MKRQIIPLLTILLWLTACATSTVEPEAAISTADVTPTAGLTFPTDTVQPTILSTDTPQPAPTPMTPTAMSVSPSVGLATPTLSPTAPLVSSTPTLPLTPEPLPSTLPPLSSVTLRGPFLVDSEAGRLYAAGQVDGKQQTFVLATTDGHLLATYDLAGPFALDSVHGWLYVDQGDEGLAVVNTQTGTLQAIIPLPEGQEHNPAPQADPITGQVLAFRDNLVYIVNPEKGAIADTISFEIPKSDDCRSLDGVLPIEEVIYDNSHRLLYLNFLTYVCTPWFGHTLVSYDMTARREISRTARLPFQAVAYEGHLYGQSWHRFGIGSRWAWRDGQPRLASTDWSGQPTGFQVDANRSRLYEASGSNLRVFDMQTMALLMVVPLPVAGQLAGYDPQTDQLYLLADGQLQVWPASAIQTPSPEPLVPVQLPTHPVSQLQPSPNWPQDKTLFGIWGNKQAEGDCYVFDQLGGQLYLSSDGGHTWNLTKSGLPGSCAYISTLAISPDYVNDRTLLVGVAGHGVFKATDGGELWRPASTGLPSMGILQILISPDFAHDQTVLANLRTCGLYRSTDGGNTWQALDVELNPVAMSPEFGQDQTLMGVAHIAPKQGGEVRISRDGGSHWERVGDTPASVSFNMLSLAPLFSKWQVAFGHSSNGVLYRSEDGGVNWQAVLETGSPAPRASPQLVYAPHIEVNRPVFLLAMAMDGVDTASIQGTLHRSGDGGLTWEVVQLPAGILPTALAISPNFAQDRTLFIGTADGQVLTLEVTD